jgi:hypothetical protein
MAKEIQATVSSGPSMWLRLIAWFYKLGGFNVFEAPDRVGWS